MYTVLVVRGIERVVGVDCSLLVTGQTVVYQGMTSVVTCGPAGQLVTVGWQDVTVRVTSSRNGACGPLDGGRRGRTPRGLLCAARDWLARVA